MKGFRSLHVGNFSVQERNLDVLVDINLLGAKIDFFVGLADRSYNLIGSLSFFDLLRLGWWSLLGLRLSAGLVAARLLVVALLIVIIAIAAALLPVVVGALIAAAAVIDGEESADRIFHLARVGCCKRSFGELENHVGLVERSWTGVVARIASDDADLYLIFGEIDDDLRRIYFRSRLEQ